LTGGRPQGQQINRCESGSRTDDREDITIAVKPFYEKQTENKPAVSLPPPAQHPAHIETSKSPDKTANNS
jgi:hypothetical protein